jgi:hypothetical protein
MMGTFLTSLLAELMVQHSSDAIAIECDRAPMPARSLRERTSPSSTTRRPSSRTSPCYGRSASISAINIRSQGLDDINKTQTPNLVPVIYDDSEIIVKSPSPNEMGVRQMSPSSVLQLPYINHLSSPRSPPRSARSTRWRPSRRPTLLVRHDSEPALTSPRRPTLVVRHDSESALTRPKSGDGRPSTITSTSPPRSARWRPSSGPTRRADFALTCPKRRESLRSLLAGVGNSMPTISFKAA